MDIVLHYADRWFLTPFIYPEYWKEDDVSRQFLSLLVITNFGAVVLYLLFATASYYFVFDQRLLRHPLRLKVNARYTNPHRRLLNFFYGRRIRLASRSDMHCDPCRSLVFQQSASSSWKCEGTVDCTIISIRLYRVSNQNNPIK